MNLQIKPGTYILAVSGGVDSMVLLDLLRRNPSLQLIVAHFDHGIRSNSKSDRIFVQKSANFLNLPFVYANGNLGSQASEAVARRARYQFLEGVRQARKATAILTAHHEDDVLETAILNMIRGTHRRGLASLTSQRMIIRPMLDFSKSDVLTYAKQYNLNWREDSTNQSDRYLRNYIRHRILSRFNDEQRNQFLTMIGRTRQINVELDYQLNLLIRSLPDSSRLNRDWFIGLPHELAKEFLISWFRLQNITNYDHKTLERVVVAAKVGQSGSLIDIKNGFSLNLQKKYLALVGQER